MSQPRRPRRLFYRRTFLNRRGHHAGAHVIAEIRESYERGARVVDADLTIADCQRVVCLDFYVDGNDGAAARRNAVHKARVLRDVVVAFTAVLEEAWSEEED
jgi:hypothetical protein